MLSFFFLEFLIGDLVVLVGYHLAIHAQLC